MKYSAEDVTGCRELNRRKSALCMQFTYEIRTVLYALLSATRH